MMKKIRFTGWNKNMNKIEFIHILNEHARLSLKESKDIKDRIVNNEIIEVIVDEEKMDLIISDAIKFGLYVEKVT
ncbi:hypothetical protein [Pedobacter africanus]|uniref:Uncharacterized protein n=1 Tax=Pedobacter africanus TaxID=151894 RepID=A0A1W2BQ79_9SPHI|nr:hypothetical protein [Pedobacter africanus]SMC75080.1 hypothetical protein SAMN04488524_2552 [Pedobacter africanus]